VTRLRRGLARLWLTGGRSARRDRRCRRRCGWDGLGHRRCDNHRRRSWHRRRRRLRIHDHRCRGQRGREPLDDGRAREVDFRVARRRSGLKRVRAVIDRDLHSTAAGTSDGPGAHDPRAADGANRARGRGRRATCGCRRRRRRDCGRAAQGRRRHLREVGRRQRQLRDRDRRRRCVDLSANRVRDHHGVRQGQRDRAREGEPEPHTAGSETADAERARGAEAVRSGECRNQPLSHVYTSG
jgi:hypothetical protein